MNNRFNEIQTRDKLDKNKDFRTHTHPDVDDLVYQLLDDRRALLLIIASANARADNTQQKLNDLIQWMRDMLNHWDEHETERTP